MDQGQPDAIHPFLLHLDEILGLEAKFQPNLQLPSVSQEPNEITTGIRDGSAHVLRCLKVWYDLPSEVLFVALNLMDRFLTKMKALPKHMACISVSTFHLAASQVLQHQAPNPQDLLAISQCKCTMGDLTRMEGIISGKLSAELPVTSLTFLHLFHAVLNVAAERLGIAARVAADPALWLRLEILACDASCANFRPSEVALVLLMTQLNSQVAELGAKHDPAAGAQVYQLVGVAVELQKLCKISDNSFLHCHEVVVCILARYNAQCQMPYRQRLVWKLSHRTLRYLRPTDKLTSYLPTIVEHAQAALPLRVRSGSLCSEESCDSEKDDPGVEWSGSLNELHPADWASSIEQQDKDATSADSSSVKLFCDALAA